jgi:hypothetical protein
MNYNSFIFSKCEVVASKQAYKSCVPWTNFVVVGWTLIKLFYVYLILLAYCQYYTKKNTLVGLDTERPPSTRTYITEPQSQGDTLNMQNHQVILALEREMMLTYQLRNLQAKACF